jgi:hypothetical protein
MKVHALSNTAEPTWALHVTSTRDWMRPAWMWSCLSGSMIGMTVSAAIAALALSHLAGYRYGAPRLVSVELTAIAAVLEGAFIGYFQWRMLRRIFPTMSSGAWVGASMIAAGSGCVLSWLPTSFALTSALAPRFGDVSVDPIGIARFSIVTGSLVGLVWGVAQYFVLRRHVHRAGLWILASVIAWTMSFVWIYMAAMLPDRSTSALIQILLGTFSGFVLGTAIGLVQGYVLNGLGSRLLTPANNVPVIDRTKQPC